MTHATTTAETTGEQKRPVFPHMLRILAVPIVLFWVAVAVIVNVVAPSWRWSVSCTRRRWLPRTHRR